MPKNNIYLGKNRCDRVKKIAKKIKTQERD